MMAEASGRFETLQGTLDRKTDFQWSGHSLVWSSVRATITRVSPVTVLISPPLSMEFESMN